MSTIWDVIPISDFQHLFQERRPSLPRLLDHQSFLSEYNNQHPLLVSILDKQFYKELISMVVSLPQGTVQEINRHAFIASQTLMVCCSQALASLLQGPQPLILELLDYFKKEPVHELLSVYVAKVILAYFQVQPDLILHLLQENNVFQGIFRNQGVSACRYLLQKSLFYKADKGDYHLKRKRYLIQCIRLNQTSIFNDFFTRWSAIQGWKVVFQSLVEKSTLNTMVEITKFESTNIFQFIGNLIKIAIYLEDKQLQQGESHVELIQFWDFIQLVVGSSILYIQCKPAPKNLLRSVGFLRSAALKPHIRQVMKKQCYHKVLSQCFYFYPNNNIIHCQLQALLELLFCTDNTYILDIIKFIHNSYTLYRQCLWFIHCLQLGKFLLSMDVTDIPSDILKEVKLHKEKIETQIGNYDKIKNQPRKIFRFEVQPPESELAEGSPKKVQGEADKKSTQQSLKNLAWMTTQWSEQPQAEQDTNWAKF